MYLLSHRKFYVGLGFRDTRAVNLAVRAAQPLITSFHSSNFFHFCEVPGSSWIYGVSGFGNMTSRTMALRSLHAAMNCRNVLRVGPKESNALIESPSSVLARRKSGKYFVRASI